MARLEGGAGNDTYRFERGGDQDIIVDSGGSDTLSFGENISYDQLWFKRTGNHLEIDVIGTDDKVTINNWYIGTASRVEHLEAGGATLSDADVQALVTAMAGYTAPVAGTENLDASGYADLLQIIGSQWETAA